MKTIYTLLFLALMIVLNSVSAVHAEESTCDWMRRLKAQQPIFSNPDDNLLKVRKVKNPSVKEALEKNSAKTGVYYYLDEDDNKITIFNGHKYSLELSVPEFAWRTFSVKWLNAKLIYIDLSLNPHYGVYWIYDVEKEKIILNELENDGWDAWQQCSEQSNKKTTTK